MPTASIPTAGRTAASGPPTFFATLIRGDVVR